MRKVKWENDLGFCQIYRGMFFFSFFFLVKSGDLLFLFLFVSFLTLYHNKSMY